MLETARELRDMVTVAAGTPAAEIESLVLAREKVRVYLENAEVVRVVQVPDRLVNVVTRPK